MWFHSMENELTKIFDASVIKPTWPKRNKFGFPLMFSFRVNDISNIKLWKNIKCVMIILFFVHDTC